MYSKHFSVPLYIAFHVAGAVLVPPRHEESRTQIVFLIVIIFVLKFYCIIHDWSNSWWNFPHNVLFGDIITENLKNICQYHIPGTQNCRIDRGSSNMVKYWPEKCHKMLTFPR